MNIYQREHRLRWPLDQLKFQVLRKPQQKKLLNLHPPLIIGLFWEIRRTWKKQRQSAPNLTPNRIIISSFHLWRQKIGKQWHTMTLLCNHQPCFHSCSCLVDGFPFFLRPIQNAVPAAFAAPVLAEASERSLKVENYEGWLCAEIRRFVRGNVSLTRQKVVKMDGTSQFDH